VRAPILTRGQLAVVLVLVLALAAAIVGAAAVLPPATKAAQPERPVRAYLQAVVAGDVTTALRLGRITPSAGDRLLTDAAYRRSSDRVTAFAVLDASTAGDGGTVRVRVTQGGDRYVADFAVVRAGAGPFAPWRLAKQRLPEIAVAAQAPVDLSIDVAGVTLSAAAGAVTQHVFPASYTAAVHQTANLEAQDARATATFAAGSVARAAVRLQLSAGGVSHADAEIADWLSQCAASSQLHPDGCPFQAVPEASVSYSAGRWTIQSPPQYAPGQWSSTLGGWPVTTSVPGYVTFTARASQGGVAGTATTGSNPFSVAGTIVPDASGELRFAPSPSYAAPGTAGSLT
jgi:hypothetical protein